MTTLFDGQRAYDHVHHLSVNIGPRLCGTDKELEAIEYVRAAFESFGLPAVVQEFRMANDQPIESRLEILEPALGEIKCHQRLGTAVTPDEGLTAELVFSEGTSEPQVGPHVEGKIVVLTRAGGNQDLRNLLKYKPAAILSVGNTIGSEPNTFHLVIKKMLSPYEAAPTVFITYEDAMRLYNSNAKTARLTVKARHDIGKSHNVIAEIKGSVHPDQIVMIGGHIDSVPNDPGATDNAAGVATVVELARVFAQNGTKRTLRFAAWGSEEQSGGGATTYVNRLKKAGDKEREAEGFIEGLSKTELDNHLLYLNLDVLGMSLGHNGCHVDGEPELGNYVHALSSELGVPHEIRTDIYGSDNITFFSAGVPALSFARLGTATQHMHTIRDSIDLISNAQLESVGRLLQVFLERTTSQGHVFPFARKVPADKLQMLKEHSLYDRLIDEFLGED